MDPHDPERAPRRWLPLAAAALAVAAAASGLGDLRVETDNASYFVEGDPTLGAYEALRARFGGDDAAYALVEVPDVFAAPHRDALVALARALEATPGVLEVRSALTSPLPRLDADGALTSRSVADSLRAARDPELEAAALRALALGHAPFRGLLLDEAGRRAGLLIRLDPGAVRVGEPGALARPTEVRGRVRARDAVVDALDAALAAPALAGYPRALVGSPVTATRFARLLAREVRLAAGLGLLAAAVGLLALFRSPRVVVAPLAVVAATAAATFGLMGHLGVPVTAVSSVLVSLIACTAVEDAMHLIAGHARRAAAGAPWAEAWRGALRESLGPCLLTTATTAAGFLALAGSRVAPVRHLGLFAAASAGIALALTLAVLPAALAGWRTPQAAGLPALERGLLAVLDRVARRPGRWVALALALVLALGAGALRLEVDHDLIGSVSAREPLRVEVDFVRARMGGAVSADVVLDTGRPDGARAAAVLADVARFEAWLRALDPAVRHVDGLPDALGEVHALFDGPRAVPPADDAVAQLLLLLEGTDAAAVARLLSRDGAALRVSVRLDAMGSRAYRPLLAAVEAEAARRLGPHGAVHLTGTAVLLARMKDHLLATQLEGFALAFAVVGGLLALLARGPRRALVALVPNVAPVVAALGLLGWAGVPLGLASVLVAPVALGIVVDDTIHLLHGLRAAEAAGAGAREALAATLRGAGRAVLATTLVLTLALAGQAASSLADLRLFGLLAALVFVGAAAADLVLLPALALALAPGGAAEPGSSAERT